MHISLCRLWKLKINYFLCFVAINNLHSVKVYVAILPSPSVRDTGTESLKRNLGEVNDCCDLWMIKLNASKTKIMIVSRWSWSIMIGDYHDSLQDHASPATSSNYWLNCAEGVRRPWYNVSDIPFQEGFWEASSLGCQSSFFNSLYIE